MNPILDRKVSQRRHNKRKKGVPKMTSEQIKAWRVERDIARESGSKELIQKAYDHRDDMMMECIQHQADRMKKGLANDERFEKQLSTMDNRLVKIEDELPPLKETAKDYKEKILIAKGAQGGIQMLITVLKYLVAAGGGAALLKFLGG